MTFCQGPCNRVFQPPLQLWGVGIYSHDGRVALARAGAPDSAIMWQGRWYSSAMVAKYTRGESARWLE